MRRSRAGIACEASAASMPASSSASFASVSAISMPAAMPPPTRLSSRPGSIAFDALRRASHIAVPFASRTRPFTCTARVAMPK